MPHIHVLNLMVLVMEKPQKKNTAVCLWSTCGVAQCFFQPTLFGNLMVRHFPSWISLLSWNNVCNKFFRVLCFTYIILLFIISFYYLLYYTRYTDSCNTVLSCMKCLVSRCSTQEINSSHESFLCQLITSLISLTQLDRWDIYISTPRQAGWKNLLWWIYLA